MTQIELRGIQKYFGAVQVIKDLNLAIADNEFIVLLGQSGCGKTTTLRAVAGLETIDEGDILIDRQPVHRHGVPVLFALSAHDGLREYRLSAPRDPDEPERCRYIGARDRWRAAHL
jgi:ABC-type nitrate/sulfonate/bicarbonate transport system ATPase subunit